MFSTFKQKLLLGIYIFILLSIPVGAYLASEYRTIVKSSASETKTTKPIAPVTPKPRASSAAKTLLNASQAQVNKSTAPQPTDAPKDSSPTVPTSYGPTLSLKAVLEGRPANSQTTKLFVGIVEGTITANPKFLLSFTVDLPASGQYTGLSLAGLNPGTKYTALLKGSAQIANSVNFTMSPAITNLNEGETVNLTSGDLNDDNTVTQADYVIAQKALGATIRSSNWNEIADLNKDGIVNLFDLSIINKNLNQVGASGVWTSPIPKVSTPSASLSSPVGSPESQGGYWIWMPK